MNCLGVEGCELDQFDFGVGKAGVLDLLKGLVLFGYK